MIARGLCCLSLVPNDGKGCVLRYGVSRAASLLPLAAQHTPSPRVRCRSNLVPIVFLFFFLFSVQAGLGKLDAHALERTGGGAQSLLNAQAAGKAAKAGVWSIEPTEAEMKVTIVVAPVGCVPRL